MSILVLGGSGKTGGLVIEEALQRGHKVTALVRKTTSLKPRTGLVIVEGSPLKVSDIEAAFTASESTPISSVIVTLASTRASNSPFANVTSPPRLMADSAANVAIVMKNHGVRKLAIMSSFGVGDSYPNFNFIMKGMLRFTNLGAAFIDHDLVDAEVQNADLDWVLVRPNFLKEGEAAPVKEYGNLGKDLPAFVGITRPSVAAFLVDAVEKTTWDRTTPCIAN